MINLLWSGLLMLLLLSGCGSGGTPTRQNDFIPLTSIEITAVSSTIAMGTSTRLTVTGNFSGQFTRDITDQATWSSSSTAFATFLTSANPIRVKGVAPGTAILTATVKGVSANYTLMVSNATVTSMAITPAASSVSKGLTTQFTVLGTFSDKTTQDLTFDSTWTSNPGTYATVSNDPASKGLATALAEGDETITATIVIALKTSTASATLKVTAPVLQSIAVTPANSSVAGFSKTVNFAATGTYSDGLTADITSAATWASSQTGIATIVTGGVATTVAAGTTSISASLSGISGKTNFTVTDLVLKANGLQITPASPTLTVGSSQQLKVTATYTDGSNQDVTTSSTWTSTFPTIASVNTTGLVIGNASGSTTISASYGDQIIAVIVTVQ
jgi:uncharacterized protein YjdB